MTALLRRVLRPLPGGRIENPFAQPERLRSSFHEFVGADVFDGALERHAQRSRGNPQLSAVPLRMRELRSGIKSHLFGAAHMAS